MPFPGRSFHAFLFDMDGTVLSSIEATERAWGAWARRQGLDVEAFLPTIHGMRAIETIRRLGFPEAEIKREADEILRAELEDLDGITPIAGAGEFLASLPERSWAIVTSAPRDLAHRRLRAAGLPIPPVLVSGNDVANGKPAPECFELGAGMLGHHASDCLAFEDAAAGIEAAEASGAAVLVINAMHRHALATSHPQVDGYERLRVRVGTGGHLNLEAAEAISAQPSL